MDRLPLNCWLMRPLHEGYQKILRDGELVVLKALDTMGEGSVDIDRFWGRLYVGTSLVRLGDTPVLDAAIMPPYRSHIAELFALNIPFDGSMSPVLYGPAKLGDAYRLQVQRVQRSRKELGEVRALERNRQIARLQHSTEPGVALAEFLYAKSCAHGRLPARVMTVKDSIQSLELELRIAAEQLAQANRWRSRLYHLINKILDSL